MATCLVCEGPAEAYGFASETGLCDDCAVDHQIASCETCGDPVLDPTGVPVLCHTCGYSTTLD